VSGAGPRLSVLEDPGAEARDAIASGLAVFNAPLYGNADQQSLAVLIEDATSGGMLGGLWGRTHWRWLYVEMLFVPETLRGRGLARACLELAEEKARERGCVGSLIDTFSDANAVIYRHLGYVVCGTVPDFPPGHTRIFLRKRL